MQYEWIILYIPILIYRPDNSGRQYVSYEVIGQNMVSVPTHIFKVIACQDKSSPQLSVEVGRSKPPGIPHTLLPTSMV